jgi:mycofactocin precursor
VSKPLREETEVVSGYQAKAEEGEARAPVPEGQRPEPLVVDEICVEELAIDGICGVY